MGLILLAVLPSFIAVSLLLICSLRRKREFRLPPGPVGLPLIGNLHQLGKLSHRSLFRLANEYGPLMYLKLGTVPTLVVSNAEIAEEVFRSHDSVFCNRPTSKVTRRLSHGGQGVAFAFYGEGWRQLRKISTLELYTGKRVESFRPIREEEVRALVKTIFDTSAAGQLINVGDMALCLFSNVVCQLIFGRRCSKDGSYRISEFQKKLRESLHLLGAFCAADCFPWLGWIDRLTGFHGRLEKVCSFFEDFIEEEIEEHLKRDDEENKDFLSALLRLRRDSTTPGFNLTRENIKSIILEIFMGGSDTAASIIEFGMLELILNPRIMKKAQEEIRRTVGEKSMVEESDLPHLVYLKLVIKETLRHRPPAPLLLPHESIKDVEICGYEIPAKTRVLANVWAIMRDPALWKDAADFWPERFEDTRLQYKGQDFQYIPFSSGRRICPGFNLGLTSVELSLANLLLCFDWELPEGIKPEHVDTRETDGIVVRLESPLRLRATARPGWNM